MRGMTRGAGVHRSGVAVVGIRVRDGAQGRPSRPAIAEVPVDFYKDREGRQSHTSAPAGLPWLAGWINLKVMLVYTPDSFLLKPGLALFVVGAALGVSLAEAASRSAESALIFTGCCWG